jgi:ribosomal protein S18 acetylase RimI-like enzyme
MRPPAGIPTRVAIVRAGGAHDVRFLGDMLRHAFHGRMSSGADGEPILWRYVAAWGRRGDRAVIACDGPHAVGAAWFRLFPPDEPGLGFLDETIPELAIAVVPSSRGRGIGAELLTALLERARADGFAALSLSVRADSPAVALYERFGFRSVAEEGGACTMRADLASPSAPP